MTSQRKQCNATLYIRAYSVERSHLHYVHRPGGVTLEIWMGGRNVSQKLGVGLYIMGQRLLMKSNISEFEKSGELSCRIST